MTTDFGETIKNLRKQHNITQAQLAQALSVGRPTIAGYETKGKQPDYDKLIRLAQFFNVSVDYLLNSGNNEYPYSERVHTDSTLESKLPYLDKNANEDLSQILRSIVYRIEKRNNTLNYQGQPLNKSSIITIKNTLKNLMDTIEEMNSNND